MRWSTTPTVAPGAAGALTVNVILPSGSTQLLGKEALVMRSLQVECRRAGTPRTEPCRHRDRARGMRCRVKAKAAAGEGQGAQGSDVGTALYVKGPLRAGQCIEHGADVIVRASPPSPLFPAPKAWV